MASPLPVRVLFVEDAPDDVELIVRTLKAGGFQVDWSRVEDAGEFSAALERGPWDVILSDYSMARFRPDKALEELQRRGIDIPLLVVSGTIDEPTAVSLMRAGARDYVLKDNLTRLVPAITRELRGALSRHEGREAHHVLRRSESFFRTVVEHASDVIAVTDLYGRIMHIAPSVRRVLGVDAEQLLDASFIGLIAPPDRARSDKNLTDLREGTETRITCEASFPHADGSLRVLECVASRFRTPGGEDAIAVNARDVTDRRKQEQALRETGARLALLNAVARAARFGLARGQMIGATLQEVAAAFPGMLAVYSIVDENNFLVVQEVRGPADGPQPLGHSVDLESIPDVLQTLQQGRVFAAAHVATDDRVRPVQAEVEAMQIRSSMSAPLLDLGRLKGALSLATAHTHEWTATEIATLGEVAQYLTLALNEEAAQRDRRHAEQALQQSEAQLRQAQKMEAIGRLAGGVAHDFNNLLTAILGYGEIVAEEIADHPAAKDVAQILDAGRRAAALTRQLLAFSRQQVLEPEIFAPNEVVANMAQLLARLLGQDVELMLDLDPTAGNIRADRGQLEQVLMNLAVNSRDAMPEGGTLRIATSKVLLESAAAAALQVGAGSHVRIEVSDNGTGMDPATIPRIFEPFFTTKEKEHGTGLGLATVYGIVSQSGGGVEVESTVGVGTTFRLYFPETDETVREDVGPLPADQRRIVLVLEPDEAARTSARRILARAGHTMLEAPALDMALSLGERNPIDVLLVGAGAEEAIGALRDALQARRPGLRVASLPPFPFSSDTLLARVAGGA